MTKLVLAALVLTVVLTMPFTTADALTATCLPSPLPATPTPPTYSLDMYFRLFGDDAVGTIRRQPCEDGSGPALSTPTSNFDYCETLTVPTTVVLVSVGPEAEVFDETAAFTLL